MDDLTLARKYISKAAQASNSGHAFTLSLPEYCILMSVDTCYYTGVTLTTPRLAKRIRGTDRTLERVDNTQGYITGNVVAVCNAANNIKSMWECPACPLTLLNVNVMLNIISKKLLS